MAGSYLSTPYGELSVETDMVEASSMGGGPDKSWTFTDEQGHEHYYDGNVPGVPYPTLVLVTDGQWWCAACHDEHASDHLECLICGEHVKPALAGPFAERVPGRRHYRLDGEEISEARFRALFAQWAGR